MANSSREAIRTRPAVLFVGALIVLFARRVRSSSLRSTC